MQSKKTHPFRLNISLHYWFVGGATSFVFNPFPLTIKGVAAHLAVAAATEVCCRTGYRLGLGRSRALFQEHVNLVKRQGDTWAVFCSEGRKAAAGVLAFVGFMAGFYAASWGALRVLYPDEIPVLKKAPAAHTVLAQNKTALPQGFRLG